VGDFFDARGILPFETLDECAEIVRGLTPELYETMRPYAAENLRRIREYDVTDDWIYEHHLKQYDPVTA